MRSIALIGLAILASEALAEPAATPATASVSGSGARPAALPIDPGHTGWPAVWVKRYGAQPKITALSGTGDTDGDGVPDTAEASAGTDPFNPRPFDTAIPNEPSALCGPFVIKSAVSGSDGVHITFPTVPGKRYQIQMLSPAAAIPGNLAQHSGTAGEWKNTGPLMAGNGTHITQTVAASSDPAQQFRVEVKDVDTDGDGVTDWEEIVLGMDPDKPQTKRGVPDLALAKQLLAAKLDPNETVPNGPYTVATADYHVTGTDGKDYGAYRLYYPAALAGTEGSGAAVSTGSANGSITGTVSSGVSAAAGSPGSISSTGSAGAASGPAVTGTVPRTYADVWVNGGGVNGYGVYDFRHRVLASWGIPVLAASMDPVVAKKTGLNRGLHAAGIDFLKTMGYKAFSCSGHSGGAGSALATSHVYPDEVKAVTNWGGGGSIPGPNTAVLLLTGLKDANPLSSSTTYVISKGPTFFGCYIGGDHVHTETAYGWSTASPYHAGTVAFMRLTLGWLQLWLENDASKKDLFKKPDYENPIHVLYWEKMVYKNF